VQTVKWHALSYFKNQKQKKKEHFEGLGDYDLFCLALNEPMI